MAASTKKDFNTAVRGSYVDLVDGTTAQQVVSLNSTIDANLYGFLPTATATQNVAAWASIVAQITNMGGGIIEINRPGTYALNQAISFPSKTWIRGLPGQVVFQQDTTMQDFVGYNSGLFEGNTDITITGIIFDQGASLGTNKWAGTTTYTILTGTATAGSATSISDSGKDFSALGITSAYYVFITGGTGVNQSRQVSSISGIGNSQINVSSAWAITPDSTSTYRVCVVKTRVTVSTTANGVSFNTQATTSGAVSSGVGTGINPWSGALLFLNCTRVIIRDCWIRDYAGNGIKLSGCSDSIIENIVLDSVTYCPGINHDGVHLEGGSTSPFSATLLSSLATKSTGSRNNVVRNIRANTNEAGRGLTDNLVALVPCDYLSQNWQGGEILDTVIENVENMMAMETIVRNIAQKQDRGQRSCGVVNTAITNVRGRQSYFPKYSLPAANFGGYGQISSVVSSTQFILRANTTAQYPDGILATNMYIYISGCESWARVTAVATTTNANDTITVDTPLPFAADQYVCRILRSVPGVDAISDAGDSGSGQGVPDKGTAFTTVASGGGSSTTSCTLTSCFLNGRTLQVGDWIYNGTVDPGSPSTNGRQIVTVNTGTGDITWSGAANFSNGHTVNLCKTYNLLSGTDIRGMKINGVFYDCAQLSINFWNDSSSSATYRRSQLEDVQVRNVRNAWPMTTAGSLINLGGNIGDIKFEDIAITNSATVRGFIDIAADETVIRNLTLDGITLYQGTSPAAIPAIIGQNSSLRIRCGTISIKNSYIYGDIAATWLSDCSITGLDAASTCHVFVDSSYFRGYGLHNLRVAGDNNFITRLTNSHLFLDQRFIEGSTALNSSDLITVIFGAGNTFGGASTSVRHTTLSANVPSVSQQFIWENINDIYGFSATSIDLHGGSGVTRARTYVFTGSSATTVSLPAGLHILNHKLFFKNRGSANMVVQRASTDNLWDTSSVTSITIAAGESRNLTWDGTYWLVQ